MKIGLIGAGNMARALALGWGEPVLCTDPVAGRAQQLAAETGGSAVDGARAVAAEADVVFICHKPAQLEAVAAELDGAARLVVSILGGVSHATVAAAYPSSEVYRVMPSTPVELRQGVVVLAQSGDGPNRKQVAALLARLGTLIELPESQIDAAMNLMSCGPAYMALVAEAQIDAGVRRGLPVDAAAEMVTATMAGTAALLAARGGDTLALRRAVASPGGLTARGLAALERGGIRAAFDDAIDSVLDR